MSLKLRSVAFKHDGPMPKENTCDGADMSPPLEWSAPPKGTRSFAVVMEDPDAPAGTWVHWLIYDIPGSARELQAALPKEGTLADGPCQGLCWGVDRFERVGYHGPCPPPGKPHRYVFTLYALDTALTLAPKKTKADLLAAMKGRILAKAQLVGLYGR